MVYREATYEEYKKAKEFAKLRYRFGVYIQLVALILLLFLIYWTVTNITEMKANPADYAEEKLGVVCSYPITLQNEYGSYGNIESVGERG